MRKVIVFLILIAPTSARGNEGGRSSCKAPTYKVAMTYSETAELKALAISINPRDVTVGKLLQLACAFRADFTSTNVVEVNIFNDFEAAKQTDVHGVEDTAPKGSNKRAFVAYYYINRKTNQERLTLVVDAGHPCGRDIDIDLKENRVGLALCN